MTGLCSEVFAVGEDQSRGGKRVYIQTSQGQVRAIVPYLRGEGNGKGNGEIPLQCDGGAQQTSLAPLGPQALPNTGHGLC